MTEVKSKWISVADKMPPKNVVVETKIHSTTMGDWCLIKRKMSGKKWMIVDETFKHFNDGYNPTHWHPISKI